ncbi:MAG: NAD-dependent epimerase/dehydratase family protein, partial [Acidimicrobiia bacterium]
MGVAIITGSAGLIGSEAVRHFAEQGMIVVGIDNDMRASFFGSEASTVWNRERLQSEVAGYIHEDFDIRDRDRLEALFAKHGSEIALVIHAAA